MTNIKATYFSEVDMAGKLKCVPLWFIGIDIEWKSWQNSPNSKSKPMIDIDNFDSIPIYKSKPTFIARHCWQVSPRKFLPFPCKNAPVFPCRWTRCVRCDQTNRTRGIFRWARTPQSKPAPCAGSGCAGTRPSPRPTVGPILKEKNGWSMQF